MNRAASMSIAGIALALLQCVAEARALSDAQWRVDIEQMSAAIKDIHFKPFHNVTEAEFDAAVAELSRQLPALSDTEIVVGMAGIIAQLQDGHTRIHIPRLYPEFALEAELGHGGTPPPKIDALKFSQLPVRFELFDDGLTVIAALPDYAGLIGQRVVAFDSTPVDVAITAVRTVSFTENDSRAKLMAPDRLALPGVLAALGVTGSMSALRLTTADTDGGDTVTKLPAVTEPGLDFTSGLPDSLPSWQKHRDRFRWYEIRPDDDAIYVQVNQFEEAPVRPYGEFVAETLRAARGAGVSRYVIDLRHNSGGIGAWVTPFVTGLANSEFNEYGRLYILIGRTTFSAAQFLLHKFEELTYAAFVGEPGGAKPSHYGDARRIVLEHSGLTVRVSTIYWHSWLANDFRDAIQPHIPATLSAADYFGGRDPVLQAAVDHVAPATLGEQIYEQFEFGNNQNALLHYTRFMGDGTADDHEAVVPNLMKIADRLIGEGKIRPGYFLYLLLSRTFPGTPAIDAGLERSEALLE